MDQIGLVLRVVVSLGLVLGLLWFAARGLQRGRRRAMGGVDLDVLARAPLAAKASVAVVRVGDRAFVLGVTEARVDLLCETALCDVVRADEPADQPAAAVTVTHDGPARPGDVLTGRALARSQGRGARRARTGGTGSQGALTGSALSPQTWGKALDAIREMTVRR